MSKIIPEYYLLILLLIFSTSIYSQNKESLLRLRDLEFHKGQDTAKVQLYISLSKKYLNDQKLDSALLMTRNGLFLAKKLEYNSGIGELYAIQGDIKVIQNELFQALDFYLNTVQFMSKAGQRVKLVSVYIVIGNIYLTQANYPEALAYYQKGKVIADSLNMVSTIVHFNNNLGELYSDLGQYEESIKYYQRAIEIYKDNNDRNGQASVLASLSSVYLSMNNIEEARSILKQALEINEGTSNNEGLLNTFNSMAAIERKEGNYKQAIEYYEKGLEHFNKIGKEYRGPKSIFEPILYANIGQCYIELKEFGKAETSLLKGYKIALKNGQLASLKDITFYLSEVYHSEGNLEKAYNFSLEFHTYSDSLSREENIKKITQLQMQYEFDKQMKQRELEQAKIDSMQRRKELIYIMLSSSIFLALLILFLLFRLQKNKVKRIILERKNLKSDLDYKNKELTTNVMYLLKKNEFIISISDKLKKTKYDFKPENRTIIDRIIHELENSSKEINWKDFEVRFQDVHTGFYKQLNKQFPDLSPNELRLCAFLRLNMTTKEISAITLQSDKSISMARFRLRKKIGMDSYDGLISFLNQL